MKGLTFAGNDLTKHRVLATTSENNTDNTVQIGLVVVGFLGSLAVF